MLNWNFCSSTQEEERGFEGIPSPGAWFQQRWLVFVSSNCISHKACWGSRRRRETPVFVTKACFCPHVDSSLDGELVLQQQHVGFSGG